jgi:hypothetical protein
VRFRASNDHQMTATHSAVSTYRKCRVSARMHRNDTWNASSLAAAYTSPRLTAGKLDSPRWSSRPRPRRRRCGSHVIAGRTMSPNRVAWRHCLERRDLDRAATTARTHAQDAVPDATLFAATSVVPLRWISGRTAARIGASPTRMHLRERGRFATRALGSCRRAENRLVRQPVYATLTHAR